MYKKTKEMGLLTSLAEIPEKENFLASCKRNWDAYI